MKKLNFVVALIYTILLSFLFLDSTEDGEVMLGTVILSVPVVVNWITYSKLK